jgi:hypothetical protein
MQSLSHLSLAPALYVVHPTDFSVIPQGGSFQLSSGCLNVAIKPNYYDSGRSPQFKFRTGSIVDSLGRMLHRS